MDDIQLPEPARTDLTLFGDVARLYTEAQVRAAVLADRERATVKESGADKLAEALRYAREVIDQLSEKAHHAADRMYCARILKEGNSIDAALAEREEQKGGA